MNYTKKWLGRRRKSDLIFIADKMGLMTYSAMLNRDLIESILTKQEEDEKLKDEDLVQRSVRIQRIYDHNKEN